MAEGLTELALDRFRDRFDFERSTDADEDDLLSALDGRTYSPRAA